MKLIISLLVIFTTSNNYSQTNIFDAARNNNVEALQQLYNTPQQINSIDAQQRTALMIASYNDNLEATKWLLAHHAAINAQDNAGNTALMGVAFKRNTNMAMLLLNNKDIQVNSRNKNGATALFFAATFGADAIVKALLEHGADKDIRDNMGKKAIDYAINQENDTIVQLLQ